jgi:DNA-binding PadR family transcriptional regulator
MSIRHGLLALLGEGPRYGSQLRTDFESRTGATWPLNVGQVYTTLSRLERDGMVVHEEANDAGHTIYTITDRGRDELASWFRTPVGRTNPPRDELAIKLAMAVGIPGVDIREVIQAQRHHTLQAMQDYTRLKAQVLEPPPEAREEVAWLLVLEQLIFQTEAEARWLDHCEARLIRLSLLPKAPAPESPAAPARPGQGGPVSGDATPPPSSTSPSAPASTSRRGTSAS